MSLAAAIGEAEARLSEVIAKAGLVKSDGQVDEVAARRAEPRERALLVGAGERLTPTTSATRIAASFRASLIAPPLCSRRLSQMPAPFCASLSSLRRQNQSDE
jgi:hypothetical protein